MFLYKVNEELSLELLQQHHRYELYDLIDTNRDHLRKWLQWVDKRQSPEDFEPIIKAWLQNYGENNGFDAGIRYKGQLVGMVALHYIDWTNRTTSIGYFLAESAQGRGIMTKTLHAMLEYIFSVLALHRVEIECDLSNDRSLAVPARLGFVQEGIKRQAHWLYDHYEDLVTFSLLADEWTRRSSFQTT